MAKNLYDILQVSTEATPEEIDKAHRKLALQYHPDRNGDNPEAINRFKEMQAAYEILADPDKRQQYDQSRSSAASHTEWVARQSEILRQFAQAMAAARAAEQVAQERARREAAERRAIPEKVRNYLNEGKPREALGLFQRYGANGSASRDLEAICLMRLGQAREAVEIYRELVLRNDILLKEDAPLFFKLNYATALLLDGNLEGCKLVLAELGDAKHPYHQELSNCVRQRSLWHRLRRWLSSSSSAGETTLDSPGVF